MNRFSELQELLNSLESDFARFYEKGNKTAGIRARKGTAGAEASGAGYPHGYSGTKEPQDNSREAGMSDALRDSLDALNAPSRFGGRGAVS